VEVSTGFVDEQYREMAMSDCDDGDDDDADDDDDGDDVDGGDDDDGVVNARSTFWFLALGPEP
jgi:hypothetical protein